MRLTEQDIKLYRLAVRKQSSRWLPLLVYLPIWFGWIFMISFYEWPRFELPIPTVFLVLAMAVSVVSNRDTVKLLEKLGTAYPELSEQSDVQPSSAK